MSIKKKLGITAYIGEIFKSFPIIETKKKVKNIGQIFTPQTFSKAVDKRGKAKRDQVSKQAHKNVGVLSMETPFLKIGRRVFERKKLYFCLK